MDNCEKCNQKIERNVNFFYVKFVCFECKKHLCNECMIDKYIRKGNMHLWAGVYCKDCDPKELK